MRTLIGKGRTSEVFKEDDIAYKIYTDDYPLDIIHEEIRFNHVISTFTKLPMDPVVATENPHVLRMKYLGTESMASKLLNREKNVIEDLVDMQLSVFKYQELPLHNIHERYHRKISTSTLLTEIQKKKVCEILDSLPYKPILVHMDFHPYNLMFYEGHYWIIDWVNVGLANPLLCIARTYILLHYHALRRSHKYLSLISKRLGSSKEMIRKIAIIQAADRIIETDDPQEREFMNTYIEKG